MTRKFFNSLIAATIMILAMSLVSFSQDKVSGKLKDAAHESAKAAEAFREIMNAPDKAIPGDILDSAQCVAVFPSTIKGGFIIGAQKGEGVVSCRTANGWSAPVFLDMSGGSIGAQIGGQSTDYVLLFMNRNGIDHLLKNKFNLGGEASVAAGPVGREAGGSTDWKLNSEILSYSRSKGLFAGVELKGVSISTDGSDMRSVYGDGVSAREVLLEGRRTAPEAVQEFPKELARFSSTKAESSSAH
ncbi:MAG TPA: lipid-binding SYLF domain-containing protein [Blastocatellia bacterium]|jgi:lipid-binding SYLF domain-containing protein|nr:lipid-binding SYLF domain-containing protein [Blastocatellia bacterium]